MFNRYMQTVVPMPKIYDPFDVPSLSHIVGNRRAISAIQAFAGDIDSGRRRTPLMLSGPPGVGKSSAMRLLAAEHGWNLIELTASDYRDRETLSRLLTAPASSRGLFSSVNFILFDEIDDLSARFDKGASTAILKLIKESKNPVAFIANDRWNQKISFLRNITEPVDFTKLSREEVSAVLLSVSKRHGIETSQEIMERIAYISGGDARCAINDLVAMAGATPDDADVLGIRDRNTEIFKLLDSIFFSNTISAPMRSAINSGIENSMLFQWIEENLPKRYRSSSDLAAALNSLSYATVFESRASRLQYYGLWRYMSALATAGVALSKEDYPSNTERYSFPHAIMELSRSKSSRGSSAELAAKMKRSIHSNVRTIISDYIPLISAMVRASIKESGKEELEDFMLSKFALEPKDVEKLESYSKLPKK